MGIRAALPGFTLASSSSSRLPWGFVWLRLGFDLIYIFLAAEGMRHDKDIYFAHLLYAFTVQLF
jgi:hypothetical protein